MDSSTVVLRRGDKVVLVLQKGTPQQCETVRQVVTEWLPGVDVHLITGVDTVIHYPAPLLAESELERDCE